VFWLAEQNQVAEDDVFAQPEKLEPVEFDFADGSEVLGARDANMKTFRNADGTFTQMISDAPIHYDNEGTWSDIDLNLKATALAGKSLKTPSTRRSPPKLPTVS